MYNTALPVMAGFKNEPNKYSWGAPGIRWNDFTVAINE
uniref:Uncharacterized protein n=1 Tax=Klebsiella pneumoniae TaxID=573 RepID=A0A6G6AP94_KLEPN|nr:hypothetical protein [Klebsiella pneumoniae]UFD96710.1 hypothetical protein [Klebsiella oxytoca]UFD96971.1 hypothetical protein [Klebsiella pneumoniae]